MVIHGDIVTLNREEVKDLINRECKNRLGMSAVEYVKRNKRGDLPKVAAVHDIEMLLKLAYKR